MRGSRSDSDSLIYFLIRDMQTQEAIAIGVCSSGEVKIDLGHILRPIDKTEYDSYIALELFPTYEAKSPVFMWSTHAGGTYFGIKMWEEEKLYNKYPTDGYGI